MVLIVSNFKSHWWDWIVGIEHYHDFKVPKDMKAYLDSGSLGKNGRFYHIEQPSDQPYDIRLQVSKIAYPIT